MEFKVKFWHKHLNWFIPFISEHYPLTKFQLLQYEEILDWDRININPFICWDNQTKSVFQDKLTAANTIDYSLEIAYDDMMLPKYPSANEVYFRNSEKIDGKLYWKDIFFGIQNDSLAMLDQLRMNYIWEFIHPPGFFKLTFTDHALFHHSPITSEYLTENIQRFNWKLLSRYWDLDWSFELLQQFEDYWVTEQLIHNHAAFNYCLKSDLDDEFIEKILG
jgi:hypothetical protein